MSSHGLIKNALYNSTSYLVLVVVSIVTTPYLVKKLTLEGYGIYILLTSLSGYFGLIDIGLTQGVTKYVAEFKANEDHEGISKSINAAVVVQTAAGVCASILLIVVSDSVLGILNPADRLRGDTLFGIKVCAIGFLFTLISGTFSATLMGFQRYDLTSKVDTLVNIVLNIVIVWMLLIGQGLREVIVVTAIAPILTCTIYYFLVKKYVQSWRFSIKVNWESLYEMLRFSSFVFVSRISNLFSSYIVRFIVSFFAGPSAVTLYVVPAKLLSAFGGLLSTGSNVLFPFASELSVKNVAEVKNLLSKASKVFASISVPVTLFVFLFSRQILSLWMGHDFAEQAWLVLSILTFSGLIASQSTVPNLIVTGLGNSRLIGFLGTLALFCYALLVPIGTKYFGILGTATAMLITTLVNIGFLFRGIKRYLHLDLSLYLRETFLFHLTPIIGAMMIFASGILRSDTNDTLVLFAGVISIVVYIILLLRHNKVGVRSIWKKIVTA